MRIIYPLTQSIHPSLTVQHPSLRLHKNLEVMDKHHLEKSSEDRSAIDRSDSSVLGFQLSVNGQVETGHIEGENNLYVKYDLVYGSYWAVLQGLDRGISQIASKNEGRFDASELVWNFPIDVTLQSLNAYGWPRIVIGIFGIDSFGRDVACGYGSVHIPTKPGSYQRKVKLFRPICSSYMQQFVSWVRGKQPELFNSRIVAHSEGRASMRVKSVGVVKLQLNVLMRGMKTQGYENGSRTCRLGSANQPQQTKSPLSPSHASFSNIGHRIIDDNIGGLSSPKRSLLKPES